VNEQCRNLMQRGRVWGSQLMKLNSSIRLESQISLHSCGI